MHATRMDDGRVRLTLKLKAMNVSDRRVAVVGSLCTVTGTDLRRVPRLGSDRGLLRRCWEPGQSVAGQPAGAVTRGAQEDGGVVLHSMRPTGDGLDSFEPKEPWTLSRVVIVPAKPQLGESPPVAMPAPRGQGRRAAQSRPPEGLAREGRWLGLRRSARAPDQPPVDAAHGGRAVADRRAEPVAPLGPWAALHRVAPHRRAQVGLEDVAALDDLQVYVDRIGRPRTSATLDQFDLYVAEQYGLVSPKASPRCRRRRARCVAAASPPGRGGCRSSARNRFARPRPSNRRQRHGRRVDFLPRTVNIAAWDGRRYAIARDADPSSSAVATFVWEPGGRWRLVGREVCAGGEDAGIPYDAGIPMPVWRAWELYDGPGQDCLRPARDEVVPLKWLDRVKERWMPRAGDAADEAPLDIPAVRSALYRRDDPASPRALRRLEKEGFEGGWSESFAALFDAGAGDPAGGRHSLTVALRAGPRPRRRGPRRGRGDRGRDRCRGEGRRGAPRLIGCLGHGP